MEQVFDFILILRCTERQLKLCRREVQRLAADAMIPIIWKDFSTDGDSIYISGAIPIDYHTKFLTIVFDKYKRRYVRMEIAGLQGPSTTIKTHDIVPKIADETGNGGNGGQEAVSTVVAMDSGGVGSIGGGSIEVSPTNVVAVDDKDNQDIGSFTALPKVRVRRSYRKRESSRRSRSKMV